MFLTENRLTDVTVFQYISYMTFQKLIKELADRGWPQVHIAGECGTTQTTISELARGETVEPRYSVGVAIHTLHQSGAKPPMKIRGGGKR